jgi:hypothetical protein
MRAVANRMIACRYRPVAIYAAIALLMFVSACSIKLVQPYNEKLLDDTQAFYKKAAAMIEEGMAVSPKTDEERAMIVKPAEHPANVSSFLPEYDALIVDSEALILRAMTGSQQIDATAQNIQGKLDELIEAYLPSRCPELKAEFGKISLTAMNFVDLKCLILKWREDHGNQQLTRGTGILKQANWEGRKAVLFNTLLAIQKAEGFKKEK